MTQKTFNLSLKKNSNKFSVTSKTIASFKASEFNECKNMSSLLIIST